LIRSKDYERAHFALSEAIKLRPDIGEAWRKLGDLFILMEMPTEAEEAYAHAFDADLSKF
jgi:tetratricopeptide (TPR) repeat protein